MAPKFAVQLGGVFDLFQLRRQIDDVNRLVGPGDRAALSCTWLALNAVGCADYFPSFVSNDGYLHGRLPSFSPILVSQRRSLADW
jgi:hypothetical protein